MCIPTEVLVQNALGRFSVKTNPAPQCMKVKGFYWSGKLRKLVPFYGFKTYKTIAKAVEAINKATPSAV